MQYGKIVIIEETPKLRQFISDYLNEAGMEVFPFSDIDSFALNSVKIADIIILCCEQFEEGIAKPVEIIRKHSLAPIIALRSRVSPFSKEKLLSQGAVEVLTLPTSLDSLCIIINHILESKASGKDVFAKPPCKFNGLSVDISRNKIICDSIELSLTKKELLLLYILMSEINHTLTHKELISRVWQSNASQSTLSVHITRIKRKIGDYGSHIHSVRGIGYTFSDKA